VKCVFEVERFVHKPYRPPEHGYRVTPDQGYDYTRCYRVLVASGDTGARKLVDVRARASCGGSDCCIQFSAIRYFSFGAEDDLDRYLFWLYEEALVDAHGVRPGLVVGEQRSFVAQSEFQLISRDPETGDPKYRSIFVHPGRLSEWGVLAGSRASKGDLALY
jgi:hypothetical protein